MSSGDASVSLVCRLAMPFSFVLDSVVLVSPIFLEFSNAMSVMALNAANPVERSPLSLSTSVGVPFSQYGRSRLGMSFASSTVTEGLCIRSSIERQRVEPTSCRDGCAASLPTIKVKVVIFLIHVLKKEKVDKPHPVMRHLRFESPKTHDLVLFALVTMAFLQMALCVAFVSSNLFVIDGEDAGIAAVVLCAFELTRRVLFCRARSAFLERFTDMTMEQIQIVNGPRKRGWPFEQTERTARGIRAADVVFRKGGHVVSIIFLFFFHRHVAEASLIFVLSIGVFMMITAQAVTMKWMDDSRITWYLFGATDRIRDGMMARHNALSASVSLSWGILSAYALGSTFIRRDDIDLAGDLVIFPLTFGDAMGEIVGTFGKHRFQVRGFGDVNQKSVEGCAAVFLTSLISTLVATTFYNVHDSTWSLPFVISMVTTLVETASFRSTDNFTIPICNCAVILTWNQFKDLTTTNSRS